MDQVEQNLDELVLVGPDGLLVRQVAFHLHLVLDFRAQEPQRGSHHFRHLDLVPAFSVRMAEGAQTGDDGFHALEAVFDVAKDFEVVFPLLGREAGAFLSQREEAGGGKVQRIVDFMNDAGAQAAQGSHFFGLDKLSLGLAELLVGGLS